MEFLKRLAAFLARPLNLRTQFTPQEQRLVVKSFVVGVVVWIIVYTLRETVHWLFHELIVVLEEGPSPFLVFVPLFLGAAFVAYLVKYTGHRVHYRDKSGHVHQLVDVEGDGLERAISLYFSSEPALEQTLTGQEGVDVRWELPTWSLAMRKFLATLATLGSGGSGGLEASVTLIGESIAAGIFKPRTLYQWADQRHGLLARLWHWWETNDPDDLQTAQLAGISAAISTLLGAPFAAAFFATEVMYRRRPIVEKLVYSLIASLTAFFLNALAGEPPIFTVELHIVPPTDARYYLILMLLGITIALFSNLFSRLRAVIEPAFHQYLPVVWQRHLFGAALTGLIALLTYFMLPLLQESFPGFGTVLPEHRLALVLGPGETVIHDALTNQLAAGVALVVLVAKLFATLATIGSGGSAGLLVPSLFFGSMIAAFFSKVFVYHEAQVLVVPAMAASLVSIVNIPLAATLFIVELFGGRYMVPALVILIVSSLIAQDFSIYRTQRESYDARQVAPGYSVRRVLVPNSWAGKTLVELDIRRRFGLNVIGLIGRQQQGDQVAVRFETPSSQPLVIDDILVVLGPDARLDRFEETLTEEKLKLRAAQLAAAEE
ncbi:MAG: chloride channel protein [Anaerolineales bacterium]|nr:chloride channel protein [Anaerolineales bacterium]